MKILFIAEIQRSEKNVGNKEDWHSSRVTGMGATTAITKG
jgi:hypothetical protein